MAMIGRHIRHDWQQFVPWEQSSVRTVCGRTSTWNATGIPGVTEQPEIVETKTRRSWGWCGSCARSVHVVAWDAVEENTLHPYIKPMYEQVINITAPIYNAYEERRRKMTVDRPGFLR